MYNIKNKIMDEVKKKNVTAELKGMPSNGVVEFPIEQASSVIATVSRLRRDLSRTGWNCKITEDRENFKIIVERIK